MLSRSEVVEALIRKLDDEEPQVAEAAETALTTIGDPSIPELLEALSEAPLHLREVLIRVLSELRMPEAEVVDIDEVYTKLENQSAAAARLRAEDF